MKTLVLGMGNELYGDDGVGIHVVRRMKPEVGEDIACEECSISGLAILDVIEGYDRLVIIDTIKKANPKTGRITILEESQLRHVPGPSPHYVSVPQAIAIGKRLGLRVPKDIRIVAVEAKGLYDLGEGLSEEMTLAIPAIIRRVEEVLKRLGPNSSD
jgi:hydrogenase maturation protease